MDKKKRSEYSKLLQRSIETILEKLSGRVEKISLFGSTAHREPDLFSDLDVLVILKQEKVLHEAEQFRKGKKGPTASRFSGAQTQSESSESHSGKPV